MRRRFRISLAPRDASSSATLHPHTTNAFMMALARLPKSSTHEYEGIIDENPTQTQPYDGDHMINFSGTERQHITFREKACTAPESHRWKHPSLFNSRGSRSTSAFMDEERIWQHLCPSTRSLAWLLLMNEMCELTVRIRETMIQTG